jgi:uncharacterized membrane protein YbaN (DUF454 family)
MILGFLFVGLAALGVVLPVLPTTPFLLLAAACFAKSSQRFYDWLLNTRVFGELIRNWRDSRSISRKAKRISIATMIVVGGCSVIFFIDTWQIQLLVASILILNMIYVARIPCTESFAHGSE